MIIRRDSFRRLEGSVVASGWGGRVARIEGPEKVLKVLVLCRKSHICARTFCRRALWFHQHSRFNLHF